MLSDEAIHQEFRRLIDKLMDRRLKPKVNDFDSVTSTRGELRFRIDISSKKIGLSMYIYKEYAMLLYIGFDKERGKYTGEERALAFAKHHLDNIRLLEQMDQI